MTSFGLSLIFCNSLLKQFRGSVWFKSQCFEAVWVWHSWTEPLLIATYHLQVAPTPILGPFGITMQMDPWQLGWRHDTCLGVKQVEVTNGERTRCILSWVEGKRIVIDEHENNSWGLLWGSIGLTSHFLVHSLGTKTSKVGTNIYFILDGLSQDRCQSTHKPIRKYQ